MATKSGKNSGQGGVSSGAGSMPAFVRCELTDAHRKVVKENLLSASDALAFIESMTDAHCKVSFSFEEQNDCYGVYATGSAKADEKVKGLCLTARGPDLLGALSVLAFKHQELLGGDWRSAGAWSSSEKWG